MYEDVIEIVNFSDRYLSSICNLADSAFGNGYLTEKRYHEITSEENAFSIALYNGEFAGFCFLIHDKAEKVAETMKLDVSQIKPYANEKGLVCHGKSIVIIPEFRKKNITNKLFDHTLAKSKQAGMRSVWVAAWKYNGKIPARKTLEANGFSVLSEKELLWFDDKDYKCIICGGNCRCSGVIYYKIWEIW